MDSLLQPEYQNTAQADCKQANAACRSLPDNDTAGLMAATRCRPGHWHGTRVDRARPWLAANNLHGHLGHGIGLRKHGNRRLRQNLLTHELRHFRGNIHV